jgi:hypothetical protein
MRCANALIALRHHSHHLLILSHLAPARKVVNHSAEFPANEFVFGTAIVSAQVEKFHQHLPQVVQKVTKQRERVEAREVYS